MLSFITQSFQLIEGILFCLLDRVCEVLQKIVIKELNTIHFVIRLEASFEHPPSSLAIFVDQVLLLFSLFVELNDRCLALFNCSRILFARVSCCLSFVFEDFLKWSYGALEISDPFYVDSDRIDCLQIRPILDRSFVVPYL